MNLDPTKLVEHVNDATAFEFPFGVEVHLPKILGLQLTKFMVLELAAALLIVAVFVPLARRLASGRPPKGRWWNFVEFLFVFVRDQVVRPGLGRHDGDRFMPLLMTLFFFIMFCNLLGLIPGLGSPTASINTTAPLALFVFAAGTYTGMKKFGALGFWKGLCPHMDLPFGMGYIIVPMVTCLEIVGLLIKHCILAIRLLANMFGGHLVLAMIIGFIPALAGTMLWWGVTPLAVLGGVAISCLELFVGCLQAFIFAFLASLFIGMLQHQH